MVIRLSRAYMKGHGGLLGIFKLKSRKDSKVLKVLMIILALYLAIVFGLGFFSMFSVKIISNPTSALFMAVLYCLIGSMSLLFSESVDLYRTGKDLETLFSLPIRRRDVMLSRFLVLNFYTLTLSLVMMIPFTLAGAMMCIAGPSWYIGAVILTLMLSFAVSSFMSFFAIVVPRKLRKPLYAICTTVFLFLVLRFGMNADSMDAVMEMFFTGILKFPISGLPLFYMSLALIPFSLLFLYLSVRCFRLNDKTATLEKAGTVGYRESSKLKALVKLEYQGIRQSDGVMFEIMGEVFIPLILIVVYVVMGIAGNLMEMVDELMSETMKNTMPLLVMMFSAGVSAISSTSFSREGKVGDLLGTLPITIRDRIHGKMIFHVLIELPAGLLMMLAFSFLFKIDTLALVLSIPVLAAFTFTSALSGLLIDISRPYTTWSEPVEAVKKNMNSMIGFAFTAMDMLLCFLPYIIDRSMSYVEVMTWSIILNVLLFPILHHLLSRKLGQRR